MNYTQAYKALRTYGFGRDESLKALDRAETESPVPLDYLTITLGKNGYTITGELNGSEG